MSLGNGDKIISSFHLDYLTIGFQIFRYCAFFHASKFCQKEIKIGTERITTHRCCASRHHDI